MKGRRVTSYQCSCHTNGLHCRTKKKKEKKRRGRAVSHAHTHDVCSLLFADGLEDVFHILFEDDFARRLLDLTYTSDASSDMSI